MDASKFIYGEILEENANIKIYKTKNSYCKIVKGTIHNECSLKSEYYLILANETLDTYTSINSKFPTFDSKCIEESCKGRLRDDKYISLLNLSPDESNKILLSNPIVKLNTSN